MRIYHHAQEDTGFDQTVFELTFFQDLITATVTHHDDATMPGLIHVPALTPDPVTVSQLRAMAYVLNHIADAAEGKFSVRNQNA